MNPQRLEFWSPPDPSLHYSRLSIPFVPLDPPISLQEVDLLVSNQRISVDSGILSHRERTKSSL